MKIMIVDDSNVVQRLIENLIKPLNLELVGTARNGKQALDMFKEKRPDLITLDITMPEMDGLECLQKIMEIDRNPKVIVISALKDKETGLKALKLGACGFLTKPFIVNDLRTEIEMVMKQCRTGV